MFINIDQAVRDAETNLGLMISVRATELRLELQQEFADLRRRTDECFDALIAQYTPKEE